MIGKDRSTVQRGSFRWAAHVAELTGWGTALLLVVVLSIADLKPGTFNQALIIEGLLFVWLVTYFRVLLPQRTSRRWVTWLGVFGSLAFAGAIYAVLRGEVRSVQLVFVPVIAATGLIGGLTPTLAAMVLGTGAYLAIAAATGPLPDAIAIALNSGIFLLSGSVAGLLGSELRSHYIGEQEEHRLATAVRHRLLAVLDAVDEAIVFRTKEGVVRVVNRRGGEILQIDPDEYLGGPVVELLRTIARKTEDPEGYMETFQQLRDDPLAELRVQIEQIIPERRQLRLYSGPATDDAGALVGRIDVYTDITEAVERAQQVEQLYEQARKTAESYQRGLLPESVPSLPRVSLVAHYIAAAGRKAVCGDFYDFVPMADGKIALVLGDVVGIGPAAANDAALARYSLKSFAGMESDPARLLDRMNAHVYAQGRPERFVRMLVAVLNPERATLDYANAGHVPPVVFRTRSGEVEWLGEGGIVLGAEGDASYKAGHIDLEPGDTLVLYTDGVTEAPRMGRPFGQGHFMDIVKDYGVGTPGELVQALRRAVDAWVPEGELRDDIALLVCQVTPDTALGEPVRELVLPNEPSRISDVRQFVAAFLADLRTPVEVSSEVQLAVGEAVANACRHGRSETGRSELRVRCALDGPDIEVTVADDGPGYVPPPRSYELPDTFASGGRGLFLMQAMMDDVTVEATPEGTVVTLRKKVAGPPVVT
jgi:serine phosphatase RsbU (regulator of sigma subunit)/anti-sigma regulatory factor (Ser/Thr protein kinase)